MIDNILNKINFRHLLYVFLLVIAVNTGFWFGFSWRLNLKSSLISFDLNTLAVSFKESWILVINALMMYLVYAKTTNEEESTNFGNGREPQVSKLRLTINVILFLFAILFIVVCIATSDYSKLAQMFVGLITGGLLSLAENTTDPDNKDDRYHFTYFSFALIGITAFFLGIFYSEGLKTAKDKVYLKSNEMLEGTMIYRNDKISILMSGDSEIQINNSEISKIQFDKN